MKRTILSSFFILIILFFASNAYSATIAFVWLKTDSPRAVAIRDHANRSMPGFTSFLELDFVNPSLILDQISRFSCTDENSILVFSKDAGIDIVVFSYIEDKIDSVVITFNAHATGIPFNGKILHRYSTKINVSKGSEISNITAATEEHSGIFLAGLMSKYKSPVFLTYTAEGKFSAKIKDGKYTLFRRYAKDEPYSQHVGTIDFTNNVSGSTNEDPKGSYFVLKTYESESDSFFDYIYGRKHEVIFNRAKAETSLQLMFFLPAMSFLSPVALPMGYYRNSDYTGLGLAAVSATPWGYLSAKGLYHRYYKEKEHLSASDRGKSKFGLYWLFLGNSSLIVDMYSYSALKKSRNYHAEPYLGSSATAAILSAITPGGGLFYRGQRGWGYFYYHASNLLLYQTLCSFSNSDEYNKTTGLYEKKSYNKNKGYAYMSGFAALKTIEIIHAYFSQDNIFSENHVGSINIIPVIESENSSTRYGVGVACAF